MKLVGQGLHFSKHSCIVLSPIDALSFSNQGCPVSVCTVQAEAVIGQSHRQTLVLTTGS